MRLNVTQNAEEKMSKNNDRRKKHIKGGLILKERVLFVFITEKENKTVYIRKEKKQT